MLMQLMLADLCFTEFFPLRDEVVVYSQPSAFQLDVPDEQDHEDDVRYDRCNVHYLLQL